MPASETIIERRKARQARIVALSAEGLDDASIADRLGISKSRVQELRRLAGVKLRPHGAFPEETVAEIRRLYEEEQWPPGEIAETLGVQYDSVHGYLGKTTTGTEWNKVARWASAKHPKLWEELRR